MLRAVLLGASLVLGVACAERMTQSELRGAQTLCEDVGPYTENDSVRLFCENVNDEYQSGGAGGAGAK